MRRIAFVIMLCVGCSKVKYQPWPDAPVIERVNGTGMADTTAGHAGNHLRDRIEISGQGLAAATFTLRGNGVETALQPCAAASATLAVVSLPTTLASGMYTLTAVNESGSCSTELQILQGERGDAYGGNGEEIVQLITQDATSRVPGALFGRVSTLRVVADAAYGVAPVVMLNDVDLGEAGGPGLFLVVINLDDHSVLSSTWGSTPSDLTTAIDEVPVGALVVLASGGDLSDFGDATLLDRLVALGGSRRFASVEPGEAYAFIGQDGLGAGGGLERVSGSNGMAAITTALVEQGVFGFRTQRRPAAIDSDAIQAGAVGADDLAAGAIGTDHLALPLDLEEGDLTIDGAPVVAGDSSITNAMLINSSLTITTQAPLAGGGTVALGGQLTLGLSASGVTPGTYGLSSLIPQISVDAQGRITSASAVAPAAPAALATNGLNCTGSQFAKGVDASGVAECADLPSLVLGVNTEGAYLASCSDGLGITGCPTAGEDANATLAIDTSAALTWSNSVTFAGLANLDGGIAVDSSQFNVSGASGRVSVAPLIPWIEGGAVTVRAPSGESNASAARSLLELDADSWNGDASNSSWGLRVTDLGNDANGTTIAIYQEGSGWDYGVYAEDTIYTGGGLNLGGYSPGIVIDGEGTYMRNPITPDWGNTWLGFFAGNASQGQGTMNTGIGMSALASATTGQGNTGVGWKALISTTTGSWNTAVGRAALLTNTGSGNTAIGEAALAGSTVGNVNVALGQSAGSYAGDANNSVFVGAFSGGNGVGGGSSNTFLGYQARATVGGLQNATAIGALAEVNASNSLVLGSATPATNVGVGAVRDPHSSLHIGRSFATSAIRTVDVNTSANDDDYIIIYDGTVDGKVVIPATMKKTGRRYVIRNLSAQGLMIEPEGAPTESGDADVPSISLTGRAGRELIFDGERWLVLSLWN